MLYVEYMCVHRVSCYETNVKMSVGINPLINACLYFILSRCNRIWLIFWFIRQLWICRMEKRFSPFFRALLLRLLLHL